MHFLFSPCVLDDGVKFLIIPNNVRKSRQTARSVQLEFFSFPLLLRFASLRFSLRVFGHFRPHFRPNVIRPGRSLNVCHPSSCPHGSFGWKLLQKSESRDSNPRPRLWSFSIDRFSCNMFKFVCVCRTTSMKFSMG